MSGVQFLSQWLPTNYSLHGRDVDRLYHFIFWICIAGFFGVQGALLWVLVKYRRRAKGKRSVYTLGSTKLELVWTILPIILLGSIALASKKVWGKYRSLASVAGEIAPAKILVIGQQFKWNVIYPGPDGKFGQYLRYPSPTDDRWPGGVMFGGVKGPRDLDRAVVDRQIGAYVDQLNPLGKVMDDPDGKDDVWRGALGRTLEIPADRQVEIHLLSRDVIHGFTLPNFRVRLDAVPGLQGVVRFTATRSEAGEPVIAAEREMASKQTIPIEQLQKAYAVNPSLERIILIDSATPGGEKDATGWRFTEADPKDATGKSRITLIRDHGPILYAPNETARDTLSRLRAIGIANVTCAPSGYFDLVCEQLCGSGHYTMQGRVVVLSAEEYARKYESPKSP